jgi:PTH1 family peptidyl-tRNA hydrolase
VSDEIALPIGKLRVRPSGSAGGHNGLKSIIQNLGTDQFPRIRLGVGAPPRPDYDMADWVLSAFHGQDAADMADAAKRAADAVECYITKGPDRAMNIFN